jgi:hypothetical protein
VPLFADGDVPLTTWAGVLAVALPAVFAVGGWVGKWLERRGQHAEVDRDARIADLKEQIKDRDRQIATREESCRLCRQQAEGQTEAVIRLHQIYGGCRAAAEAVHGCMQLSNDRLRRANARLAELGKAPEPVPDEPKLWFPDRAEAEFLVRSTVQGQKVVEAVQAEVRRALPTVPAPPGPDRGG